VIDDAGVLIGSGCVRVGQPDASGAGPGALFSSFGLALRSRTIIEERNSGCNTRARATQRGQYSGSMCAKRLVCSDKPHREQFRYMPRVV
jgi:hypothetical protein